MKLMALSGVFVLASAGLALATAGPSGNAAPKSDTATLVSVSGVEAAIVDKKLDPPEGVTQAAADCTAETAPPICDDARTKH